jgi:uncharacterized membrane protein
MIKRISALFKRIRHDRITIDDLLLFTFLFGALLLIVRIGLTGKLTFVFLPWNLFLALLPYLLSSWLKNKMSWIENKWLFGTAFVLWLLLIPNSFYIITDLFHLDLRKPVPLWYDLLLIFSFAWNGLLLGILSFRQMEQMLSVHMGNTKRFIFPLIFLNGLGVYIGRYLRYNSWDVISDPFGLMKDIGAIFIHPLHYRYAWGMIIGFSVLLSLLYITFKKISISNQ